MLPIGNAAFACAYYYCSDTIGVLYVDANGAYISPTNGVTGLTNCTPLSGVYLTLPKSDPNYSSYYAALLAARLTGQSLTIRTLDGSNGCNVGYITIP